MVRFGGRLAAQGGASLAEGIKRTQSGGAGALVEVGGGGVGEAGLEAYAAAAKSAIAASGAHKWSGRGVVSVEVGALGEASVLQHGGKVLHEMEELYRDYFRARDQHKGVRAGEFMPSLSNDISWDRVNELFYELDKNRDGLVGRREWVSFAGKESLFPSAQRRTLGWGGGVFFRGEAARKTTEQDRQTFHRVVGRLHALAGAAQAAGVQLVVRGGGAAGGAEADQAVDFVTEDAMSAFNKAAPVVLASVDSRRDDALDHLRHLVEYADDEGFAVGVHLVGGGDSFLPALGLLLPRVGHAKGVAKLPTDLLIDTDAQGAGQAVKTAQGLGIQPGHASLAFVLASPPAKQLPWAVWTRLRA
jgi:hypothetical protein